MRCEQCEKIPLCEITTPVDYLAAIDCFRRMIEAGELEATYQTCPLDLVILQNGKFFADRLFHQYKCTKCGTVYGMLVNTHLGGEIKINQKAFDPSDYPDTKKED